MGYSADRRRRKPNSGPSFPTEHVAFLSRRQLRYIFPKERSSIFVPPAGAAMDRPASAIWRRSNPTSTTVTLVRMLLAKVMVSRSNMMPGGRKGRGLRYRDSRERPNELAGHRH